MDGCAAKVVDADRAVAVCERMPSAQDLTDTADVFGLLSDTEHTEVLHSERDGVL
ncbi:hypothetical protein OG884_28840 [Streptosporangium sp. NBC_01755]|uniref:hypothetical protein n=1 Tax=unclassified Streptosporangium TaxID=2632669 RepID=UPI002DDC2ECC|nr:MULTISPECIES: hypothetical protein [unclassified Streptosporangium]WSA23022.1 hypothetical protein OIE13_18745 [Streptosporangium sp. NBC_01810]WSC98834.1 hypothetical protein OG884_28840 [Streptosporangium sp. NBC_01755]